MFTLISTEYMQFSKLSINLKTDLHLNDREISCVLWRKQSRSKEVKLGYHKRSWWVGITQGKMTGIAVEQFIIIANCVVNIPLAFVAITGNALVLYAVWKTPALRSPSILLLCGLASTDVCVGLIAQPLFIAGNFIDLFSRSGDLKFKFEKEYKTMGMTLCGASLFMVAGVGIDRLIAIVKPLQYPSVVTSSKVTRILVAIWVFNALAASTQFWDKQVLFALTFTCIFVCSCICIICHATMHKIMRRHRLQIHAQVQAIDDSNTRAMMVSLRKSAFNTFVLFIVLVICYSPYLVVYMVNFIGKAGDLTLGLFLSATVMFLNSALNPFLYCWRIREIRLVVLRKFKRPFSRE